MEFTVKAIIPAPPKAVYNAWLDSEKHTAMTGGEAKVSDQPRGSFTAWDGYIEGRNMVLEPHKRIVQTWRTFDFGPEDDDSQIEILFEEENGQTKLTLNHSQLTAEGEQYIDGWDESYFQPMKKYFSV